MSTVLDLPPPTADVLEEVLRRDASTLGARERRVELSLTALVALATLALVLAFGVQGRADWPALVGSALLIAAAMHVRFDVGSGFTVPTQLGFVPLLFATPPALLPVAVVVAIMAGRLPGVVRGTLRPSRLLLCVPNSTFALGPAAVLAALGPRALDEHPVALLALAFVAQVAVDGATSCARDAYELGVPPREQLRELPVYAVDALLTPTGYLVALAAAASPLAPVAVLPLMLLLGAFARERRGRMESMQELNSAYRGVALVLGDVIEADDYYTGEHSRAVVDLAVSVGGELALARGRLRDLEFAALLHDVGKVAIPKAVINAPRALTPEEWELVKTHTVAGQQMLDRVGGFMCGVGRIVRSHHERWDGTGYPDRLSGAAIPLEARIVACCDAYNAMTTDRPYRKALPAAVARDELRANSARQFDPEVVEALLRAVAGR